MAHRLAPKRERHRISRRSVGVSCKRTSNSVSRKPACDIVKEITAMRGRADMAAERNHAIGRRSFLLSAGSLAAASMLGGSAAQANAQAASSGTPVAEGIERRMLGSL